MKTRCAKMMRSFNTNKVMKVVPRESDRKGQPRYEWDVDVGIGM